MRRPGQTGRRDGSAASALGRAVAPTARCGSGWGGGRIDLLPNLRMLRFPVGQAYLWRDPDSLTLIDTGLAGAGGRGVLPIRRTPSGGIFDGSTGPSRSR